MTHAAPRRRGGRTWIVPAAALLIIVGLVVAGLLSRALALDFVSWSPLWLVLAAVALLGRGRKIGALRVPGLVSLVTLLCLGALVFGHLQGWDIFPSSRGVLFGSSDQSYSTAALSARIPGATLDVGAGESGTLYTASPVRLGGETAAPSSVEHSQEDGVSIEISPVEGEDWFLWAGWNLDLSPSLSWTLTLEGDLDVDLSGLAVANLQAIGAGHVILGRVTRSTPVTLSGELVVEVPGDLPVRVIGPAEIPPDWSRSDTGASSPTPGQGWVISVDDGSVVRITDR